MQNILVVDDEQSILKVISGTLENNYKVFTSETVIDAERIAKDNKIDLLITDLVMPEKNGIDLIMEFKKEFPDMIILAISGGGGIKGRFDYLPIAKLVGATYTMEKPFNINELRNKVEELLQ